MTFLEKLDWLMSEHGMNKRTFALASGIPYTTIDGFWKKGYENAKISTLKKIAKFFNVSLDFLIFDEETINQEDFINGEEKSLLQSWRQADDKTRRKVSIDLEDYGFVYHSTQETNHRTTA